MASIIFVTGNLYKYESAQRAVQPYGITLIQKKLDLPEIQSTEVEEIAYSSALEASLKLGEAVVVEDVGYYIPALNGFPGPFVKYVNQWFSAEDYLRLLNGISDRRILVRSCIAYAEPGKLPITFSDQVESTLANKPGEKKGRTSISEIFIPDGFDRTESDIPRETMVTFWSSRLSSWKKLAEHISNK